MGLLYKLCCVKREEIPEDGAVGATVGPDEDQAAIEHAVETIKEELCQRGRARRPLHGLLHLGILRLI